MMISTVNAGSHGVGAGYSSTNPFAKGNSEASSNSKNQSIFQAYFNNNKNIKKPEGSASAFTACQPPVPTNPLATGTTPEGCASTFDCAA